MLIDWQLYYAAQ